ncbi:MAG: hypothetical protein NZ898_02410 [Myxococcota bacterium]|nr:hypothetical protein [Myxococcota bacterium]MDW8362611.1 hypothetical protein [Myxococcales bacterium]
MLALSTTVAFALPGTLPTARATLAAALDLEALVRSSTLVVEGRVERASSRFDALGRIVTDAEVRVLHVTRGHVAVGTSVIVRSFGGEIGETAMRIEGEPALEPGLRAVFFLRAGAGGGYFRPVGMSQGVLPIVEAPAGDLVLPGAGGLALVRQDARGVLAPAAPALSGPTPLAELRARLARLAHVTGEVRR